MKLRDWLWVMLVLLLQHQRGNHLLEAKLSPPHVMPLREAR